MDRKKIIAIKTIEEAMKACGVSPSELDAYFTASDAIENGPEFSMTPDDYLHNCIWGAKDNPLDFIDEQYEGVFMMLEALQEFDK